MILLNFRLAMDFIIRFTTLEMVFPKHTNMIKNHHKVSEFLLTTDLAVYYTYESNPSDGWADAEVHNDSAQKREEALEFGTNIVVWALSQ